MYIDFAASTCNVCQQLLHFNYIECLSSVLSCWYTGYPAHHCTLFVDGFANEIEILKCFLPWEVMPLWPSALGGFPERPRGCSHPVPDQRGGEEGHLQHGGRAQQSLHPGAVAQGQRAAAPLAAAAAAAPHPAGPAAPAAAGPGHATCSHRAQQPGQGTCSWGLSSVPKGLLLQKSRVSNLGVFNLWIHRWWTSPRHLVPTSLTKSQWKDALEQRVGASLSSASLGLAWRTLRYVESGPWSCSRAQLGLVSQEGTNKEDLWIVPTWFCSFSVMFHAAMVCHFFLVSSTVYME